MLGTRFEEHESFSEGLPFGLQIKLFRTPYSCTHDQNWHDALELQLCTSGEGSLLVDGVSYPFLPGDVAAIDSGVIHYTGTETQMEYTCLIVGTAFCQQVGLDYTALHFTPCFRDDVLAEKLTALCRVFTGDEPNRRLHLHALLTDILFLLVDKHTVMAATPQLSARRVKTVKKAIQYLRTHYQNKVTLDSLAAEVCADKFGLCRDFRRFTGQTIVTYLNQYRCMVAENALQNGCSVTEAAQKSGFDSASFFCKTYKKCRGVLPSHVSRSHIPADESMDVL